MKKVPTPCRAGTPLPTSVASGSIPPGSRKLARSRNTGPVPATGSRGLRLRPIPPPALMLRPTGSSALAAPRSARTVMPTSHFRIAPPQVMVDQRHGEGTFVRSSAENDLNPAFETFLKNHESIYDLMEVRFVLEAWAASTAAERANPDQIAQMRSCLEEMAKAKLKGKIGYELNLEFHRLISVATHNTILIHVTNALSGWFQQVTAEVYVKMYEDPQIQDILFLQHQTIVTAIEKRNREEAYEAMIKHLSFAANIFPKQKDDHE